MQEHNPSTAVTPRPKGRPEDIAKSVDFYHVVGILVGLLFLGAFALWMIERWRKRNDRGGGSDVSLTNFRAMFEAGELSHEEYEKIRGKLAGKIKADLGIVPPPAPPKSE